MLKVKDKTISVPGEILCEGMDYLPSEGTYRKDEEIRASRMGLVHIEGKVIKIIPMKGRYLPKEGDTIIGKVFDILISGWRLDINSPYSAVLSLKEASNRFIRKGADLTKIYALEDYVVAKITNVTSQNLVDLTLKAPGLRKLHSGRIIKVIPNKVPRIIGKKGSMIRLIKEATGCFVTVGQNGYVWLKGEPKLESIAVEAIELIEKESHKSGLTDRIKIFLEKQTGKKIELKEESREEEPREEFKSEFRRDFKKNPKGE